MATQALALPPEAYMPYLPYMSYAVSALYMSYALSALYLSYALSDAPRHRQLPRPRPQVPLPYLSYMPFAVSVLYMSYAVSELHAVHRSQNAALICHLPYLSHICHLPYLSCMPHTGRRTRRSSPTPTPGCSATIRHSSDTCRASSRACPPRPSSAPAALYVICLICDMPYRRLPYV